MKKILLLFVALSFVVGCSCSSEKPSDAVEKYLNNYKNLDEEVIADLDDVVEKEDLDDDDKEMYRTVLKRQYSDLVYEITDEEYNGDTAKVTAKITVYDYFKADKESQKYLEEHKDEFLTDDKYDATKFMKYKLEQLKTTTDTIEYSLDFDVKKENGVWQVEQLDDINLEKIHGMYDYENAKE